jgi:hypothetical protein
MELSSDQDLKKSHCLCNVKETLGLNDLRCSDIIMLYNFYIFSACFPLLRKKHVYDISMLSVCTFQFLNQVTSLYENLYQCYSNEGHSNLILLDFLQSVIRTQWTRELLSLR